MSPSLPVPPSPFFCQPMPDMWPQTGLRGQVPSTKTSLTPRPGRGHLPTPALPLPGDPPSPLSLSTLDPLHHNDLIMCFSPLKTGDTQQSPAATTRRLRSMNE